MAIRDSCSDTTFHWFRFLNEKGPRQSLPSLCDNPMTLPNENLDRRHPKHCNHLLEQLTKLYAAVTAIPDPIKLHTKYTRNESDNDIC